MYKIFKVSIINFILIVFFILLLELLFLFFIPQNLQGKLTVLTEFGYANKSSGSAIHNFKNLKTKYFYSYPHLRKTFFESKKNNILVLGDSFTFGYLLNIEDTYLRKIEECYQFNYNFLNAATGGFGLSNNVGYVENFIENLKPKIIIYFLNTTDIGRSYLNQIYKIKNNNVYLTANQKLKDNSLKKFANNLPFYEFLIENSHLFQFIRKKIHSIFITENKNNLLINDYIKNESYMLGELLFKKLNQLSISNNAKLIVISLGFDRFSDWSHIQEKLSKDFLINKEKFFRNNNISFIDLGDDLVKKTKNNLKHITIKDDGHPNSKGAEIIGELSCKYLKREFN